MTHIGFQPPPATTRFSAELFPPLPICWPTLTDNEVDEYYDALADWIAWLVNRYALDHRTVPPCWDQPGALTEELSALRTAWLASYAGTARPEAPLEWHNHFAAARQRLADWVARTGCRPGEHRPNVNPGQPPRPSSSQTRAQGGLTT